jgi:large subunit ribosomal protein L15
MIHDITRASPRFKKPKRKGRGRATGQGKTSGRGNKGAKARVGKYVKRGHEHGQTPIYRRLPKRGFSNFDFESRYHVVNLADLEQFADGATVDATALREAGLIPDYKQPVKILGEGALSKKLNIVAGWYSKSAHEKILGAGGTAKTVKGEDFQFPKPKKKFVPREGGPGKKKAAAAAEGEGAATPAPMEGSAPAAAPTPAPAPEE